MLEGARANHVGLVAGYWARFSVRMGGGLLTLCLVLLVGLGIASAFISPLEALIEAGPEVGHSEQEAADFLDKIARSDQVVDVVEWMTGDADQAAYLLRTQPALLSAIFLVLLIAVPFLAVTAGFNQLAGDVGSRGLRFVLLRTERPNVFFGRFLGTTAFFAISLAVTFLVLVVYVAAKFRIYSVGAQAWWGFQGFFGCLMLALPYLALCAWISGLMDSAFGSFMICTLLAGFPVLFIALLDATMAGDQGGLMRILPWGWKFDLLDGDVGMRLLACAVLTGFTALFLALGLRSFGKRDL
jgi:hypothetical protein